MIQDGGRHPNYASAVNRASCETNAFNGLLSFKLVKLMFCKRTMSGLRHSVSYAGPNQESL